VRCRAALLALCTVVGITSGAQSAPLAVADREGWRGLWRADSAPTRWRHADSSLLATLRWSAGRSGIAYTDIPLRGDGEAWRTRAIIVRFDPERVRVQLDTAFRLRRDRNNAVWRMAQWQIENAPTRALLSVNAGQFDAGLFGSLPWGWVVLQGREWQPPGVGPLSMAIAIDSGGSIRLLSPAALVASTRTRGVVFGFQSFPTLLEGDGTVPAQLRAANSGVDLTHRDTRLAIGVQRDGTVLIVLTRFDVFGPTLGAVPFGLTTPEMAALMGALGCQTAVMLDGGISAQMQLTDASGTLKRWRGWRKVPMGLVVLPKP
jgi:Phosphodiester glycosidase